MRLDKGLTRSYFDFCWAMHWLVRASSRSRRRVPPISISSWKVRRGSGTGRRCQGRREIYEVYHSLNWPSLNPPLCKDRFQRVRHRPTVRHLLRKTGCQGIVLRGEVFFIEIDAKALNALKSTSIHSAARRVESCATKPIRGGPARKPA